MTILPLAYGYHRLSYMESQPNTRFRKFLIDFQVPPASKILQILHNVQHGK